MMFKILVIQAANNLSDERTEFLINDRLSFMRFLSPPEARLGAKRPRGCATPSTSPAEIATHALTTPQPPQVSPERALIESSSYAFLGRTEDSERATADLIAKNGEQVLEVWFNEGDSYARTNERDLEREAFRKLGFRVSANEEELKKFDNPKRLPECVKS
jgi:hypothetical protein